MFITIEGIDGAGLSTQSGLLNEYLLKKGKKTLLTKEPTNSLIGGLVKAALKKEWSTNNIALQTLLVADRAHHLASEIEPVLKKNVIVICDRYILSSIAYGSLDIPLQHLKQLNSIFRKPDITILLDAHPKIALERIKTSRYSVELFETEQHLTQVRKNYLSLKNFFSNTYVIDANNPADQVFKDILKAVEKKIY
ncbi:MAG: dTMP kinase [Candidatus Aenigmarchaeota archaeon]|nr:dTMP kinase [Candidatus Aenigmarchaeota archaeon]